MCICIGGAPIRQVFALMKSRDQRRRREHAFLSALTAENSDRTLRPKSGGVTTSVLVEMRLIEKVACVVVNERVSPLLPSRRESHNVDDVETKVSIKGGEV